MSGVDHSMLYYTGDDDGEPCEDCDGFGGNPLLHVDSDDCECFGCTGDNICPECGQCADCGQHYQNCDCDLGEEDQ